jgi:phospholipid transport system transporter-binding protein
VSDNGVTLRADGVAEVVGVLTFATVPDFYRATAAWLTPGAGALGVDLARVTRVDSAGVALMLEWLGRARAAGRALRFLNLPEQAGRIISVSGLTDAFAAG